MSATDFFRKSFLDAKGNPDGKLLTLFGLSFVLLCSYPIGWVWGRWLPDNVFNSTLLFLATGFGLDAFITKTKIQAEAQVATAGLTGDTPAAPATATTTTQTVLTTDPQ